MEDLFIEVYWNY